jgi:hypothetical protein
MLAVSAFSSPLLNAAEPEATAAKQDAETLYALHHLVIPGILFSDNGARFFNDLFTGKTGPFLGIVEDPLGKTYASGLKIVPQHYQDFDLVMITFPGPITDPLCFHSALIKKGDTFRYFTLEKGTDISNIGTETFFCEWKQDRTHKNYGSKKYETSNEFRTDLIDFLKQK